VTATLLQPKQSGTTSGRRAGAHRSNAQQGLVPSGDSRANRMRASHPVAASIMWSLCALSLLAIWLVAYAFLFSEFQESHAQHNLYGEFRLQLAAGVAPLAAPIHNGRPVALLDAPKAGMHDVVVVQGTSPADLETGPGHRIDSVLPGQAGTSVIFGRDVTFGGPFRHLASFSRGDSITVTTGQGKAAYIVDDVRVAGDPYPAALASGASRLVLESSVGGGYRSEWAPTQSIYVDADLTSPFPAGQIGPTVQAQRAMAADKSALLPLVLWLQLFVLADIGFIWARSRWGVAQAWLVGTPVLFALAWLVTSAAALLLPNLF
jgi:sortase A